MWVWEKVAIAVIYYDSRDLSLHLKEMNWKSGILDWREKNTLVTSVRKNVQESLSLSYAPPVLFFFFFPRLQYEYAAA